MRAALVLLVAHCSANSAAADPRYFFDARCPLAASFDDAGTTRVCSSCIYTTVVLSANATAADCATACCGDWSCLSFVYSPPAPPSPFSLNGSWVNHDSLRGESGVVMSQVGSAISATSTDPSKAYWSTAEGVLTGESNLWLCFDCGGGDTKNNRTGVLSDDNATSEFAPSRLALSVGRHLPSRLQLRSIACRLTQSTSRRWIMRPGRVAAVRVITRAAAYCHRRSFSAALQLSVPLWTMCRRRRRRLLGPPPRQASAPGSPRPTHRSLQAPSSSQRPSMRLPLTGRMATSSRRPGPLTASSMRASAITDSPARVSTYLTIRR